MTTRVVALPSPSRGRLLADDITFTETEDSAKAGCIPIKAIQVNSPMPQSAGFICLFFMI
ncbi:hypothetical protein APA_1211 [Pseudanabaena sp. lw0831]|nr:hypothetical protein APA_1211 [Pseudanabaena sp. lw0831]